MTVERMVDAILDASNIVSHDGYYELDTEAATRSLAACLSEALRKPDLVPKRKMQETQYYLDVPDFDEAGGRTMQRYALSWPLVRAIRDATLAAAADALASPPSARYPTHPATEHPMTETPLTPADGLEAAALAERARIVAALRADAQMCDCHAYEASECACGAWDSDVGQRSYKRAYVEDIADAIDQGTLGL